MPIIGKISLSYISRLILKNIIFRFLLLLIFLFLVYIGLGEENSSYFISALVLFFIIYPSIKEKNKVKYIIALSLNLLLISLFWYIIGQCLSLEIMYSFMGSYILLGFDDFDLSGDVESVLGLRFHNKCIGDPGGPGGPDGGPDLSPYLCMDRSDYEWEKRNNMNDRLKILHNHPALHNYKEYIQYENFKYKVSTLEIDIKQYNDNLLYTKTNEFVFEKQKIKEYLEAEKKLNNIATFGRSANVTPMGHISEIQHSLYELTLEYNTLRKAKLYYENKGLNLSKDYEVAFDIWQKRQIAMWLDTYSKLKLKSLGIDSHIPNWYDNSTVYDEVRENLLYVEYSLIKIKAIYDGLSAKNFNYFKLDNSEFDNFILPIQECHYEKYKECRNFLNEKAIESFDVDHMPKSAIQFWYKQVYIPYKEHHDIPYKEYHDGKVGLGLAEKFSKKKFDLTNYMSNLYKN